MPVLSEHTFLGWGDKKRGDQLAAIREAGSKIVYYYKNNEAYTLDALWGSLSIEGDSKVYDGRPIDVKEASFALNNVALSDTYATQYKEFLNFESPIQYSTDKNSWTTELSGFKFVDAGSYTLYAKQEVIVTLTDFEGKTKTEPRDVVGQATYTITPRDVTLTSGSAEKEYDGTALTNNTVTAEGFVNGEGATYNVTGTQTEVGSSENKFTYTLNSNTKPGNYNITTHNGTLKVTEKTTPDPVVPNPTPNTTPTPTPTPIVTPAPTAAPSTDDTTPENTATPAPTATCRTHGHARPCADCRPGSGPGCNDHPADRRQFPGCGAGPCDAGCDCWPWHHGCPSHR